MNKVISNHTKNVKLYINLAPCSSWNLYWMQASLYTWRALISHVVCLGKTSSSWYKYSGLFLMPKILLYAQNSQCVRNSIFPNGKYIFPTLWKILKFEVMEYLIPYVKFEMLILNSTVKLKLGPKFFQFIYRFKTVFFLKVGLRLYFQVFSQFTKRFFNFWMLLQLNFSTFSNSWKRWKIRFFEYELTLHFQIFPIH